VYAAEIRCPASNSVKAAVEPLKPQLERQGGGTWSTEFSAAAAQLEHIRRRGAVSNECWDRAIALHADENLSLIRLEDPVCYARSLGPQHNSHRKTIQAE